MSSINLENLDIPINFKAKVKSIEAILNENFGLTQFQIEELTSIKRDNEESLLNLNKPDFFYEICFLLKNQDYKTVLSFLKNVENDNSIKLSGHFIFNTEFFEKEQKGYQKEISRLRDTIDTGVKSFIECRRCHSNTVSDQYSARQRSSDEAQIFILYCNTCGLTWKE
jgi:DNA-directed RNA polymerase subunit M/transcription elongation factor TFIIS